MTACRAILTALDAEPGKPLTMAGVVTPAATPIASLAQSVSRMSVDQMLDLMIARLTMIANAREASPPTQSVAGALPPMASKNPDGSRGLRVPVAAASPMKVPPRATPNVRRPARTP